MEKMMANLKNEEGSVIIMALIVLVALTMIGIVASDNTVVELQVVRNESIYRQNLYKAESAVTEAAVFMDNNDLTASYSWIIPTKGGTNPYEVADNWTSSNSALSNNMDTPGNQNDTRYAAKLIGIAGSEDMTNPSSLYSYSVYGHHNSTTGQGRSLIRRGYNKRY